MKDLNIFPFYSKYQEEFSDKKYKAVLFNPGKAVQARELIDMQFYQFMQMKENFSTIYKNGSLVEGLDLQINGTTANISDGKFFFDDKILYVDEQSITISGTGEENLGLYVKESVITVNEDSTLKDPAYGYSNYGLDGAARLKIEVFLVKIFPIVEEPRPILLDDQKYIDEIGVTSIWNLKNGIVQNYIRKPDYSLLSQTLAKRTYDESGHYLVEGLSLSTVKAYDSNKIKIVVSPGICYVKGFDNTYIVDRSVDVLKSLTTETYLNEPHQFINGTLYYTLIYPYVDTTSNIQITSIIKKNNISITRNSGDYDSIIDNTNFTYTSIESIVSIPDYVLNVDYELSNDQIHWLTTNRPEVSTNYNVTFRYYKNSIKPTDFDIVPTPNSTSNQYSVLWKNVDNPDDQTNFLVDYSIYQARTDLVSIDKNGDIIIKTGVPTSYDKTLIPSFNSEMLPIGWIKFFPGKDYDSTLIYEYNFKRTTMYELHNLKQRVSDIEENVSALALEREVKEGEDSTRLKGIYVDAFNSLYQAHVDHPDYYVSTNLVSQELGMVSVEQDYENIHSSDSLTNIKVWNNQGAKPIKFSLSYATKKTFFEQNLKSETMNLNPYGFIQLSPFAYLNPPKDSWIDTVITEKTVVENKIIETHTNKHQVQWVSNPNGVTEIIEENIKDLGNTVKQQKIDIANKLITYARQKTISITGKNFQPASRVTAIVGGIYCPLIAVTPYRNEIVNNASTGKIIVASDGSFSANFKIPPKCKSGDIEVKVIDENNNVFSTIYKSKGVQKIIENRTTVIKNKEKDIDIYEIVTPQKAPDPIIIVTPPPIIITDPVVAPIPEPKPIIPALDRNERLILTKDPLAQSFIFKDDKVLIGIDLFFATKADNKAKPVIQDDFYNNTAFSPELPAILTIGFMKNGMPDADNIIHMQHIHPEAITTSLYGDVETYIELIKPVYIPAMKDFYISIGSKSKEYTVYVAKHREKDLETGSVITSQAYQDGSLFASSNGITWTPLQEKDLAIRLYEANYNSTGKIEFENIAFPKNGWNGFGRFIFFNDHTEVPNSKINYYYSLNNGTTWTIFNPSDEIAFNNEATQLKIKCEFSTELSNISSIMDYKADLIFFKYDISKVNQYRSKILDPVPAYNNVKVIMDENVPSTTSLKKEISPDGILFFRLVQEPVDEKEIGRNFVTRTYVFEYNLLQKLSVNNIAGLNVGDNVKYTGSLSNTGKITAISGLNVYVLLNSDNVTRFTTNHTLSNGTVEKTISNVTDYNSLPAYPTKFCIRLLLESSSYFRSVAVQNLRSVFRNL